MSNNSIEDIDNFIEIINTAIDNGDVTILVKAIKDYENSIPTNYITCCKSILYDLLVEKMEATLISSSF